MECKYGCEIQKYEEFYDINNTYLCLDHLHAWADDNFKVSNDTLIKEGPDCRCAICKTLVRDMTEMSYCYDIEGTILCADVNARGLSCLEEWFADKKDIRRAP